MPQRSLMLACIVMKIKALESLIRLMKDKSNMKFIRGFGYMGSDWQTAPSITVPWNNSIILENYTQRDLAIKMNGVTGAECSLWYIDKARMYLRIAAWGKSQVSYEARPYPDWRVVIAIIVFILQAEVSAVRSLFENSSLLKWNRK